jgi:hypothetical protein
VRHRTIVARLALAASFVVVLGLGATALLTWRRTGAQVVGLELEQADAQLVRDLTLARALFDQKVPGAWIDRLMGVELMIAQQLPAAVSPDSTVGDAVDGRALRLVTSVTHLYSAGVLRRATLTCFNAESQSASGSSGWCRRRLGTRRKGGRRTLSPRARRLLPARPSSPAPEAGQPVISYSKGRPVSRS